jgi:hypothetical protein
MLDPQDQLVNLKLFNEIGLPQEDLNKIFYANAKRFFALPDVVELRIKEAVSF